MPISSAKAATWPSLLDMGQDVQPSQREGTRAGPPPSTVWTPLSLQGNQPGDNRDEREEDKEGKGRPSEGHVLSGSYLSGMRTPAEGVLGLWPSLGPAGELNDEAQGGFSQPHPQGVSTSLRMRVGLSWTQTAPSLLSTLSH